MDIGLGGEQLVGKLRFEGKTPVGHNGFLKDAEVYAKSGDGEWEKVKDFSFEESANGNGEVIFDEPVAADRIKVTVIDSFNEIDYKLACIGEIHVYKAILPEPFEINVSVNWQDGDDKDGARPENVEVGLKIDGKAVEDSVLVLNESNGWTGAFENIDPESGESFEVYCITEDFDSSAEKEGYLYECAGSVEEGFVVSAVRSEVLNTEVHWIDNDNEQGKRPDTVTLVYEGGGQTEVMTAASSHVLPDTVDMDLVVPKYGEDGAAVEYTVSGGSYSDTDWLIDTDAAADEDGIYVVNYRLETEDPGPGEDLSTEALEEALKRAEDVSTENVIPSAAEKFEKAKEEAQAVLDAVKAGDPSVTQEQIDESCKALNDAMNNLPLKADKTELEALVKEAEEVDADKYTDESMAALNTALKEAVEILANEELSEADQKIVDEAAEKLDAAIKGLVEKDPDPEEPGTGDPDPEDPSDKPNGDGGSDGGNGNTGSQGDSSTGGKAVKTGDVENTALLWAILLIASAGACVYAKKRKMQ